MLRRIPPDRGAAGDGTYWGALLTVIDLGPRRPMLWAMRELDVLTLNVWGLPWPLSSHRQRRFEGIVEHLAGRRDHVVGLQEVWGGSWKRLPLPALQRAPRSRDSGLALSGLLAAGAEARVRHFQRASGTDQLKAKGVLAAELEVPGIGGLRVLVTHLQAGRRAAAVRAHQVDELLEEAERSPLPTILMGDFNLHEDTGDDHRAEQRVASAGFVDAAVEAQSPEPTWEPDAPYSRGRHPAQRFDRIYCRGTSRVELCATAAAVLRPERPLSDHHPVWARIALRAT